MAVATVAVAAGLPAPGTLAELPPDLLASVVMIKASSETGGQEAGAGVVLYHQGQQLTVLTAHHVLRGDSPFGRSERFRNPRWAFDFYDDDPPDLEAAWNDRRFSHRAPRFDHDLMLVRIELSEPPRRPLEIEVYDLPPLSADERDETVRVVAVGWDEGGWVSREGRVERVTSDRIIHTAPIEPGFSGGPLFGEDGKLLGINVAVDEKAGRGIAIPVGAILRSYRGQVNPMLVRGEVDTVAHQIYRRGLRSVARRDWTRARDLMSRARDQFPKEGQAIHLRGMRYTRYVPSYYFGLAAFRLGDCDAARQAWSVASLDEGLGGSRRQNRMRKMRRICMGRR